MKLLSTFLLVLSFITIQGNAHAYPDEWENFDQGQLDAVADATLGSTQDLLEERGSVECIACHGETDDDYEGVINTLEITEYTMEAAWACMDWELIGVCIWLACTLVECHLDESIKVKNNVPDLVVQSYDRANGEPWTESQDINQVSQGDADSSWVTEIISWLEDYDVGSVKIRGGVSTEGHEEQKASLYFKLVDAYGNPALITYNTLVADSFNLACEGKSTLFYPYLISNLDSIAWRWDIPEMFYPQSWLPLMTVWDLGNSANNYGPIYPRHGFMHSHDPLKAAVLSAFRAAHVLTRGAEAHVYFSIFQSSEDGYWPAPPLDKGIRDSGTFQMLYPKKDTSCRRFPYSADPSGNRRSTDGSYVWNFWKKYACCERRGQWLLFDTPHSWN